MKRTPWILLAAALLAGCRGQTPSAERSPAAPTVVDFPANPEYQCLMLTPEQHRVLREGGTEAPFTSALLHNKAKGVYACAGCGLELFSSETKYDSGSGWPSFYAPIAKDRVAVRIDESHGMIREENVCARCGGHLGHVFPDGPEPTGLRHCMNGLALKFIPAESARGAGAD